MAILDSASGYWELNSLSESSGFSSSAQIESGSLNYSLPIVSGNSAGLVVSSVNKIKIPCVCFTPKNMSSFSLELSIKVLKYSAPIYILGHKNYSDGLYFDGSNIVFSVKTSDGTVSLSSPIQIGERYTISIVYSSNRLTLFVNGIMVDTEEINMSNISVSVDELYLYSGQTSGTSEVLISDVSYYPYPVSRSQIYKKYLAAIAGKTLTDIDNFGGLISITPTADMNKTHSFTWDYQNWLIADGNYVIASNKLTPEFVSGSSILTTWVGNLTIGGPSHLINLDYAQVTWTGSGNFDILVSKNEGPYISVYNGERLFSLDEILNEQYLSIDVKVVFMGGAVDDASWVSEIKLDCYENAILENNNIRVVSAIGTVDILDSCPAVSFSGNHGIKLYGGGLKLAADSSNLEPIAGVNILFSISDHFSGQIFSGGGVTVTYNNEAMTISGTSSCVLNGVQTSTSFPIKINRTYLLSFDISSTNSDIYIGTGNSSSGVMVGNIGFIGLSQTYMSDSEKIKLFKYITSQSDKLIVADAVVMSEPTNALFLNNFCWSSTA